MGAKGAEFLANMEKSDPQIEAANEKQLGPGGPEDKAVREAERELEDVDGIPAALSPDDRRAPSCYDDEAGTLSARFRLKEGAPCPAVPWSAPIGPISTPRCRDRRRRS